MSDDADEDWFEAAIADEDGDGDDHETVTEDGDGDAQVDDARGDANGEPADRGDGAADEAGFGATGTGDSAFGDVGTGSDPFGEAAANSPFGSDPYEEDLSNPSGEGLFDEDFASAMNAVGGSDFEDEDFETDIPRIDLGIAGLDNMIQGGVPRRHLIVVVGGAGTGKTTFGLEYLNHGLEKDDTERGVFITLEQSYGDIMATASERDWAFERHEANGNLAVIDLDPVEMANSLDNIRGELPALIEEFGADRFVLDSVSLLEMMYDDQAERRTEIFDFVQSLKQAGVTTVFTSEASEDNPYASRHGIIEYLTDAVILLRYVRSETQETRLAVEIQKIRNANHSRETKPYEITMDGISVYEQANIF